MHRLRGDRALSTDLAATLLDVDQRSGYIRPAANGPLPAR